jgi:hypothetical protein
VIELRIEFTEDVRTEAEGLELLEEYALSHKRTATLDGGIVGWGRADAAIEEHYDALLEADDRVLGYSVAWLSVTR